MLSWDRVYVEYLKKISQVVKILDKFLALKYSENPSENEIVEAVGVIAIKILDDDGCLTKEAIEKADSLKKTVTPVESLYLAKTKIPTRITLKELING